LGFAAFLFGHRTLLFYIKHFFQEKYLLFIYWRSGSILEKWFFSELKLLKNIFSRMASSLFLARGRYCFIRVYLLAL
jgi:hypothetical protein